MKTILNLTEIQKLLHHRPPYLLIDSVINLSVAEIVTLKTPSLDKDFYLAGHFPHAPVVPGAMMQEMTTQSAGLLMTQFYSPVPNYNSETTKGYAIGVLSKVYQAKFINFAKPNDQLEIRVKLVDKTDNYFVFTGEIIKNQKITIMKNKFALTIISDEHLFS